MWIKKKKKSNKLIRVGRRRRLRWIKLMELSIHKYSQERDPTVDDAGCHMNYSSFPFINGWVCIISYFKSTAHMRTFPSKFLCTPQLVVFNCRLSNLLAPRDSSLTPPRQDLDGSPSSSDIDSRLLPSNF